MKQESGRVTAVEKGTRDPSSGRAIDGIDTVETAPANTICPFLYGLYGCYNLHSMFSAIFDPACDELDGYAREVFQLVRLKALRVFCANVKARQTFEHLVADTGRYISVLTRGGGRRPAEEKRMGESCSSVSEMAVMADRDFAEGCQRMAEFWNDPVENNEEGCLHLSCLARLARECSAAGYR